MKPVWARCSSGLEHLKTTCFLRPQTERLHGFGIRFQILEVLPVPFTASLLVSVANHQGQ